MKREDAMKKDINIMPAPQKILCRVDRALKRIGLLNKSCDYIRTATGMAVPSTTAPDFNSWIIKLERLPTKVPRYNKRAIAEVRKTKAQIAKLYYAAHKKTKKSLEVK